MRTSCSGSAGTAGPQLSEPLTTLRQQEFLRWQGEPVETPAGGWSEYHDCQVCRFDWEAVPNLPGTEGLVRALRPAGGSIRLSLEGGFSVPGQNVWLEGFPPSVCVRADAPTARLSVQRLSQDNGSTIQELEIATHTPRPLSLMEAGSYLVRVTTPQGSATRFVRVARWDQLEPGPVFRPFEVELDHATLRGACLLQPDPEQES